MPRQLQPQEAANVESTCKVILIPVTPVALGASLTSALQRPDPTHYEQPNAKRR